MTEDHKIHDGKKPEKETNKMENNEGKVAETIKEKKTEDKKHVKKDSGKGAVVNGKNLSVGLKHAVALSNFIKGKDIDHAIVILEEVTRLKRAVPMRGEIPHRKGKGMMSGRYPVKGAKEFIILLKSLKSNAIINEVELEKYKLHAIPNQAARPYKRFGQGRFKRSHVTIKLIPIQKQNKEKKN